MNHAKRDFVKVLAEYLAGDQARKSIELQMGKESAQEWAKLRNATPLFGWQTVEEAEVALSKFLGIS